MIAGVGVFVTVDEQHRSRRDLAAHNQRVIKEEVGEQSQRGTQKDHERQNGREIIRHLAAAQIHADCGGQAQWATIRDDGLNARMLCSGQQRGSATH